MIQDVTKNKPMIMMSDSDQFLTDSSEWSSDELTENHVQVPVQFHGVYFLLSKNPKFKGRTYIGYTVNPIRRLKQHNGGIRKGGARKTSGRGPWDMILVVHGFPNDIAALRFEWAWQHPSKSRRIDSSVVKHVSRKTSLQSKLHILSYMLSVGPWHRLPLTIRWLKQDYEQYYPATMPPPLHMPMLYGPFEMTKEGMSRKICIQDNGDGQMLCQLCGQEKLEGICASSFLHCYHKNCLFMAHVTCFAVKFCSDDEVIPVISTCSSCSGELLWGELIKSCSEV